ncbi:transcription factor 21-like isoform X2 [Hyalella azteca]|nr:transcription factor 21-like isoform X2 [Hyalella azteca]
MQGGKSGRREKPVQRNAANARERTRMRILARAFCRLKTTLPWVPPDTKLSKLDTLRLAASYIAHLRGVLTDPTHNTAQYDARLSWPYAGLSTRDPALLPCNAAPVSFSSSSYAECGTAGCGDIPRYMAHCSTPIYSSPC